MPHLPPEDAGEADDDRQIEKDDKVSQCKPIVHRAEIVPVGDPVGCPGESFADLATEHLVGSDDAGRVVAEQVEMDDGDVQRVSQAKGQPGLA
jgi:hypothetical protein